MKYTAASIQEWETTTYSENQGQWVPARPVNFQFLSLRQRLILAWQVFIGKYDVLDWQDGD